MTPTREPSAWHWVVAWGALGLLAVVPLLMLAVGVDFLAGGNRAGLVLLVGAGVLGWLVVACGRGYVVARRQQRARAHVRV